MKKADRQAMKEIMAVVFWFAALYLVCKVLYVMGYVPVPLMK